jgi:hypothetical protein
MPEAVKIIIVISILAGIACFVFWWRDRAWVKSLSEEQLELEAFRFETKYFEFLGSSKPSVIRYRKLVDSRDLLSLQREWRRLSRDFHKLEREAGHKSRPLIMDYFGPQQMVYSELFRRRSQ